MSDQEEPQLLEPDMGCGSLGRKRRVENEDAKMTVANALMADEFWTGSAKEEQVMEDSIGEEEGVQPMTIVGESNKRRRPQYPSRLPRGGDHPVDSVPCMINELERLLEYIASRPKLSEGSASFMRDYLRTMLMMSSNAASNEVTRKIQDGTSAKATIDELPHEVVRHVFSFLEGNDLAKVRVVCKQWNIFATEDVFWKELCLRGWASLETDQAAWKLVDPTIKVDDPHRWRKLYPRVQSTPRWKCRLQKTGKFICNLRAHHISGPPLGEQGLPYTLVVERRFNIAHLHTFVLPEATILYLEPVTPQDRPGFENFIDYLVKRTRAGLALEGDRRFIFVPPCDYSRDLKYEGQSLLGVVQGFFPPLQS